MKERAHLLLFLYLPAILLFFPLSSSTGRTPWFAFNLALWPVAAWLSIAAHELGHLVFAWLARLRPFRVVIGKGTPTLKFKVRSVHVTVAPFPISGFMGCGARSLSLIRGRLFLATIGGPATSLAVAWFLADWTHLSSATMAQRWAPLEIISLASLVTTVSSLVPGRNQNHDSDGLALLRLPFRPRSDFSSLPIIATVHDANEAMQREDFDSARAMLAAAAEDQHPLLSLTRASLDLMTGRPAAALVQCRALLESDHETIRGLAMNNAAWAAFLMRDRELLSEALTWSERALGAPPKSVYAHGTRAAILWWNGETARAREECEIALSRHTEPRALATNACLMALISASSPADARTWLDRARAWDPRCELLAEAEAQQRGT